MEAAPAGVVQPGDLSRAEVLLKKAGARLFDHRTATLATAQSKPGQRCAYSSLCSSLLVSPDSCALQRLRLGRVQPCRAAGIGGQPLLRLHPAQRHEMCGSALAALLCRYAMCPPSHGLTREDAAALAASRPDFKFGGYCSIHIGPMSVLGLPPLCICQT
jgi:hypothetical protein